MLAVHIQLLPFELERARRSDYQVAPMVNRCPCAALLWLVLMLAGSATASEGSNSFPLE